MRVSSFLPGVFFQKKTNHLYFVRPYFKGKILLSTCANGSSEMVTNLAGTVTTYLFNITILKFAGESGVAAVGIIMYAQFLLISVFLGYSQGVAPVFGYTFGAKNNSQLKRIFFISLGVVVLTSIMCYIISLVWAENIIGLFVAENSYAFELSKKGFYLFSTSFIFMGLNIFTSAMFTALSNGKISAILSFTRTFVFVVIALLVLPLIIGIDGVWIAVPIAELLALIGSIYFLFRKWNTYFL